MAWTVLNLILLLLVVMAMYPRGFVECCKQIRRWIRDDFKRNCTPDQWRILRHKWDDLDD